jgi:hypothetical protein
VPGRLLEELEPDEVLEQASPQDRLAQQAGLGQLEQRRREPRVDEGDLRRLGDPAPEIRGPGRHEPDEERGLEQGHVALERGVREPDAPADVGEVQQAPGPREGLRDARDQEHVSRAGQQEAARPASAIDGDLDGQQQARRPLDLVNDGQLVEGREESRGIPLGRRQGGSLVQGDVAVRWHQRLGERGLPRLARADQKHDRGVPERGRERLGDVPS